MSKARHDLLARFEALEYETKGGEITVTSNPQPSRAVRMPDRNSWWPNPRSKQDVVTAMCAENQEMKAQIRELMERLAAMEQGRPATLTVTVRPGQSQVPAPTRPYQPAAQTNVRPCPIVQARAGNYGNDYSVSTNHDAPDRSNLPGSNFTFCPLVGA